MEPRQYSVDITYDRQLVRRALNRFMLNRIGVGGGAAFFFILVILFGSYLRDAWSPYSNLLVVVFLALIVALVYVYILRLNASEGFFEKSKNSTVRFIFSEDGVRTESDVGSSELRWIVFDELLKFSDIWLLIYAGSGYLTLPLELLSAECRALIEEKLNHKR